MATRSFPYVSKPTDHLRLLIQEAITMRFYLVQEKGPTCFVVKSDSSDKKHTVRIGSVQSCTCRGAQNGLCHHILFVMLKIFRIPPENPMCWQRSLTDAEVTQVLKSRFQRASAPARGARRRPLPGPGPGGASSSSTNRNSSKQVVETAVRREIEEDDVCPICQDTMSETDAIMWCRMGCGNNVHSSCLKVWGRHRISIGEEVTCPYCRAEWGPMTEPRAAPPERKINENMHYGTTCMGCRMAPIDGARYRCSICAEFNLCTECFGKPIHTTHAFNVREKPKGPWAEATRTITVHESMPGNLVRDLQTRDLSPADYETLLALDRVRHVPVCTPQQFVDSLESFFIDHAMACQICNTDMAPGTECKTLSCHHAFHSACTDSHFKRHRKCPVCSVPLYEPVSQPARRRKPPPQPQQNHQHQHQDRPAVRRLAAPPPRRGAASPSASASSGDLPMLGVAGTSMSLRSASAPPARSASLRGVSPGRIRPSDRRSPAPGATPSAQGLQGLRVGKAPSPSPGTGGSIRSTTTTASLRRRPDPPPARAPNFGVMGTGV